MSVNLTKDTHWKFACSIQIRSGQSVVVTTYSGIETVAITNSQCLLRRCRLMSAALCLASHIIAVRITIQLGYTFEYSNREQVSNQWKGSETL